MRFTERKQKSVYLLEIIEKGWCKSPKQLAEKFEVSERTAKRFIAELREEGHDIYFCRKRKMYYLRC